ncbi:MAG: DUF1616 domain-containing protein [Candidatus Bathyarchaeota archaeon]|nr:DUF1616 domain-containing protein [Candidatus Bathyarchaeota archaeon]
MVNRKILVGGWLIIAVALCALASAQQPTLSEAEVDITAAYQAILAAHQSGADITQLTAQINNALNLTQHAQLLEETNPQQAQQLTSQAQAIAQNVTAQAQAAGQSASVGVPAVVAAAVAGLLAAGVITYLKGPGVFWRIWYKLRRNYLIKATGSAPNDKALVITPRQLCAAVLALTVLVAFIAVSGVLLPRGQGEEFSELGILGPNLKLGDYPSVVVASETVRLYVYVGNQMGKPMLYEVQVKLGDNNTAVNPANASVLQQNWQVLDVNQTWTYPVQVTLTEPGVNQRLIFELWLYNQTISQFQYHQRWGQIWLNVTSPAS